MAQEMKASPALRPNLCPVKEDKKTVRQSKILKLKELAKKSSSSYSCTTEISVLDRVSSVLKSEGIVAFPTDTLYGLAGLAQSTDAINKIYNVKERHSEKPLSICVGNIQDIFKWAKVHCDEELLERLLPGPVTLLFERRPELNPDLNPGVSSIGIRIPDHDFVRDLCLCLDKPLALTSANASATQSTLNVHEFEYLWPKIDLIVDGGQIGAEEVDDDGDEAVPMKRARSSANPPSSSSPSSAATSASREGSTVVDLSRPGRFRIVRQGSAHEHTLHVLKDLFLLEEDE